MANTQLNSTNDFKTEVSNWKVTLFVKDDLWASQGDMTIPAKWQQYVTIWQRLAPQQYKSKQELHSWRHQAIETTRIILYVDLGTLTWLHSG